MARKDDSSVLIRASTQGTVHKRKMLSIAYRQIFDEATLRKNSRVQAIVRLARKYQVAKVQHKEHTRNVLIDWSLPLGDWFPVLGKKFDRDDYPKLNLYISGSKDGTYISVSCLRQLL